MKTETLHCENGNHKWTRNSTRGRKPRNCPTHPQSGASLTEHVERAAKPRSKPAGTQGESKPKPATHGEALAARVVEAMSFLVEKDNRRRENWRKGFSK